MYKSRLQDLKTSDSTLEEISNIEGWRDALEWVLNEETEEGLLDEEKDEGD